MTLNDIQQLQSDQVTTLTKPRKLARVITTRVALPLAVVGVAYLVYKSRNVSDVTAETA